MKRNDRVRRSVRSAALGAITWIAAVGVAQALPPCPTWFPDFRCERHGRYEGFVPTMMHPYLFEDPFITTGVNAVGIYHEFPPDMVLEGGNLWDAALQARVAITDRVAFIATKDGFVNFRPGNPVIDKDYGFTDITLGLKGSVIDKPEIPFILTPSLRFQIPVGSQGTLQGNGNGVFIPDISAAWGYEKFHVIGDFGGQFPIDTDKQSTSLFYHLHLDYALFSHFVPFFEVGGFYYLDGGDGSTRVNLSSDVGGGSIPIGAAASGFEGYDYANLGLRGVGNNNLLAYSLGIRVPINKHVILGAAYEAPLTNRRDVLKQRASVMVTVEY
jgi:hypothetical protein